MLTATHDQVTANVGEKLTLSYPVRDGDGNYVDVSAGVTGEYKIARQLSGHAILTINDTLSFSGHTVSIELDTEQVQDKSAAPAQLFGDFEDQLKLTKDGSTLYVATGPVRINQVIS